MWGNENESIYDMGLHFFSIQILTGYFMNLSIFLDPVSQQFSI